MAALSAFPKPKSKGKRKSNFHHQQQPQHKPTPDKKPFPSQSSQARAICYVCGSVDHLCYACPQRKISGLCSGGPFGRGEFDAKVIGTDFSVHCLTDTGSDFNHIDVEGARQLNLPIQDFKETLQLMNTSNFQIVGKSEIVLQGCPGLKEPMIVPLKVAERLPRFSEESPTIFLGLQFLAQAGGVLFSPKENGGFDVLMNPNAGLFRGSGLAMSVTQDNSETHVFRDFQLRKVSDSNGESFWEADWKWNADPSFTLSSLPARYSSSEANGKILDEKLAQWRDCGFLEEIDQNEVRGVLPMFVTSRAEHKDPRAVGNYISLNRFIDSSSTQSSKDVASCLRSWRRHQRAKIRDIERAFLQVRVPREKSLFQCILFEGRWWRLCRVGFGCVLGPDILEAIMRLSIAEFGQEFGISNPADVIKNYFDDCLILPEEENRVSDFFKRMGLKFKDSSYDLSDCRVLGLQTFVADELPDVIQWRRPKGVDPVPSDPTFSDLASWSGRLVPNFPVAGWLRPLANFLRRVIGVDSKGDFSQSASTRCVDVASHIFNRISKDGDPCCGRWFVSDRLKFYFDAGGEAIAACVVC